MYHFYLFSSDKKIICSDLPVEKIKKKFGHRYEVITSVKDKASLDVIKPRVARSYPNLVIEDLFIKERKPHSEETKQKIAQSKIGKPRDPLTKSKISNTMKGKSNFEGKKHSEKTKQVMREQKLGNDHVKDTRWVHDPRGTKEKRIRDRNSIPEGFRLGRDYYSVEPGLYYFKQAKNS